MHENSISEVIKQALESHIEVVEDLEAIVILARNKDGELSSSTVGSLQSVFLLKSKFELDYIDSIIQNRLQYFGLYLDNSLSDEIGANLPIKETL